MPTDNIASTIAQLLELLHAPADHARGPQPAPAGADAGVAADTVTFVSVGRLSPEKNHARLIRAFAQVHERHPRHPAGHPRRRQARGRAPATWCVSLGLSRHVTVAGQVDNPFAIMAEADCFVLSSDYEGQPMVILEARTLGLPVVTTAFSSVGDSVPEDAGIVVPQTDQGVADGMQRFLAGEVPAHARSTPTRTTGVRDGAVRAAVGAYVTNARAGRPRRALTRSVVERAELRRGTPTAPARARRARAARRRPRR